MTEYTREKAFLFFTSIGNYTGESASSFQEFGKKIRTVDNKSLEFHLYREDFQRWIRDVLAHEELAEELNKVMLLNLKGEKLRTKITNAVSDFRAVRKKKKRKTKPKKEAPRGEESSEEYPPPYQEHAYELKMERRLKRLLKEQKRKA